MHRIYSVITSVVLVVSEVSSPKCLVDLSAEANHEQSRVTCIGHKEVKAAD